VAAGSSKQAAVESKQGSLYGKVRDKVQRWREMRNTRLSLLRCSVARGRQQEISHSQVGSTRASPLAFSPVAGQPRHFSKFPKKKMARNAKCAFFVAMAFGRARQAAGETLISKSGLPELAPLLSTRSPVSPDRFSLHQCQCVRGRWKSLFVPVDSFITEHFLRTGSVGGIGHAYVLVHICACVRESDDLFFMACFFSSLRGRSSVVCSKQN